MKYFLPVKSQIPDIDSVIATVKYKIKSTEHSNIQ